MSVRAGRGSLNLAVTSWQVAAPAVLGIVALASGQLGGGIMLLGLAALAALAFWLWWVLNLVCNP